MQKKGMMQQYMRTKNLLKVEKIETDQNTKLKE